MFPHDKPPYDPVNYNLTQQDLEEPDFQKWLDTLTDVPESPSLQPIDINEAGITNQQAYIKVSDINNWWLIKPVLCDIEIGVLLQGHRGIHMSRCEEALFEVQDKTFTSVDEFALELAKLVRGKQKSRWCVVRVKWVYLHSHITRKSNRESHDKIYLLSEVNLDANDVKVKTGLTAHNITACPCTRTYTKFSVIPALREKWFSLNQIKDILDTTLTGTHTQRGVTTVIVDKSWDVESGSIYRVLDRSTHLVYELLKRPDEHDLVVRALKKPQFTEDVVRDVTINMVSDHPNLPDSTTLIVESVLHDSIHIHDVRTKVSTNFEQVRKVLRK